MSTVSFTGSGGVTDQAVAFDAAVSQFQAASDGSTMLVTGKVRYAKRGGTNGSALTLRGGNRKVVTFAEGAELIMDNLDSSGAGTSHGIVWLGAGDRNSLVNARVRWASVPKVRSTGDGIRIAGYPSDASPPAGWKYTTGTMTNFKLTKWSVKNAPQVGAIFMGCSDPLVQNGLVDSTLADGLHFNACRRPVVVGHQTMNNGDDSLAFVTYYDPVAVWQGAQGPFNQPSLGDWSNNGATADGLTFAGGRANGVRISGSQNVTVTAPNTQGKGCGVIIDSAIVGPVNKWAYHASRGVHVASPHASGCTNGLYVTAQNVTADDDPAFWEFDVIVSDATSVDCPNWSFQVQPSLAAGVVAGVHFVGVTKAIASATTGPKGGFQFVGLRDCSFEDMRLNSTAGAGVYFATGNDLQVGSIQNPGGPISMKNITGLDLAAFAARG